MSLLGGSAWAIPKGAKNPVGLRLGEDDDLGRHLDEAAEAREQKVMQDKSFLTGLFTANKVPLWAQNLFGSAFYLFLLRQFFLGIPRELFEAARVDGASYLRMFIFAFTRRYVLDGIATSAKQG